MKIFLNNHLVDQSEAKISVFDHGFLYGDGVFEGIRFYQRRIFKLEEHLERLEYSAKAIMLKILWTRKELIEAVCQTCRANNLDDGYIRLVISRGVGNLGLNPKNCTEPQLVIIADKIQLYPESLYNEGMKIITVPTRRINPAALPPMVKSMNYLNNILAKLEAVHLGYEEALMLNDKGEVAECTGDNVFILHKGVLFTPSVVSGALKGITRQVILDIAKNQLGLPVEEVSLTRYDVWNADECFLTGTAAEVIPVVEVDGRKIGQGKPGIHTINFIEAFRQYARQSGYSF